MLVAYAEAEGGENVRAYDGERERRAERQVGRRQQAGAHRDAVGHKNADEAGREKRYCGLGAALRGEHHRGPRDKGRQHAEREEGGAADSARSSGRRGRKRGAELRAAEEGQDGGRVGDEADARAGLVAALERGKNWRE